VQRELIEDLLWAAVQAPSPPLSGDTPWSLCVIEGVERIARYGARALEYARDHQPAGRPWAWTERPGFKVFWDAPALVLICARAGNTETPFRRAGPASRLRSDRCHGVGLRRRESSGQSQAETAHRLVQRRRRARGGQASTTGPGIRAAGDRETLTIRFTPA
jgi:hypothetical protein